MNKAVLDASAVLAYLFSEAGADQVLPILETGSGLISAVNYAELVSKLMDQGMPTDIVHETLFNLELEVVSYDMAQAFQTGALRLPGKALGLSLGDRACLALGMIMKLPILTADRVWKNLSLPIEIIVIRA
jgi:PIN domain nuclease of toxin-antitoxin system